MKIIYNKYIPFKGYKAINLFGYVFARKQLNDIDINHEKIHTAQMKEMLYIFFYIWYITEWLFNMLVYSNTKWAYFNIRFEKEAYNNETDLDYLNKRKLFAWLR